MAKFFKNPFALTGDKTTIPEPVQGSGAVSYTEGFGFDYERDQTSDPLAKAVPRDQTNELFYQVTLALQQYQTNGFPEFITSADNGGTAYSYGVAAFVRYDDGSGYAVYKSLVDSNTSLPTDTTKWEKQVIVSPIPTGTGMDFWGSTLPSGFVWGNGQTIGNASSGATGRANADTEALYTLLWNSTSNTILTIQTSSGVATTRGISAAADYAANKRLPLPDKRDKTSVGKGDMGGTTAAGLLTVSGSGISSSTLGATGGVEAVTLSTDQIPSHNHGITTYQSQGGLSRVGTGSSTPEGSGVVTQSTGGGQAHTNTQPSIVCNYIIKL